MNEGIRPHNLSIGQELRILRPKPLISVKTVTEVTTVQPIKFEVLEHVDNTRPKGYSNTVTYGKDGSEAVTEHIIHENGIFVSREVARREIIEEARPEQIVRGPR
jgi:uncharacterized protein YabE (DUF348 family)